MGAITDALKWVLVNINHIVSNYGWSIVVFTILVKLALMPLDIRNRKGMRRMAQIQPELNKLQKKYANDKQKLQQKQSELMRKENYSPLSGCLPLLIQMPILFAMFGAMRELANEQVVEQVFQFLAGKEVTYSGWLWVKNIWAPDSLFATVAPNVDAIRMIPLDVWKDAFENPKLMALVPQIQELIPNFGVALFEENAKNLSQFIVDTVWPVLKDIPAFSEQIAHMPGWEKPIDLLILKFQPYVQYNGYLILPVLAGLSQVLMTKLTPGATGAAPSTTGQEGAAGQAAGMTGFMKYFFPLFSVYITLTSNAGFALYWVVSNLIATGLNILITRHYDNQDKLAAANQGAVSIT